MHSRTFLMPILELARQMGESPAVLRVLANADQTPRQVTRLQDERFACDCDTHLRLTGARLIALGLPDELPIDTPASQPAPNDPWTAFLDAWWSTFGTEPVGIAHLVTLPAPIVAPLIGFATTDRGRRTALGRHVRKHAGHRLHGYDLFLVGNVHHTARYRLFQGGAS